MSEDGTASVETERGKAHLSITSPSGTYVTTIRMTPGEALQAYHALGDWLMANPALSVGKDET